MNTKAKILAAIMAISVAATPVCSIQANAGASFGPDPAFEEISADWDAISAQHAKAASAIRKMVNAITIPTDIYVFKYYRVSRGTKAAAQKLANKLANNPYGVMFAVDKASYAGGSYWLTPGFKSKSSAAQFVKRANKTSTGWSYSYDKKSGLYIVYTHWYG